MNGNKINNIKEKNVANHKKNVCIDNQSSQVSSYHHRHLKREKRKRKRGKDANAEPCTKHTNEDQQNESP